jgi:hypothetical protein
MKRCVLFCGCLAVVCLNLSAQVTSLLEDMHPGLALTGGWVTGKEVSGLDLQAGWSFNPRWDMAVAIPILILIRPTNTRTMLIRMELL